MREFVVFLFFIALIFVAVSPGTLMDAIQFFRGEVVLPTIGGE